MLDPVTRSQHVPAGSFYLIVNFGILPLEFTDEIDFESIEQGDVLIFREMRASLDNGSKEIAAENESKGHRYVIRHRLFETDRDDPRRGSDPDLQEAPLESLIAQSSVPTRAMDPKRRAIHSASSSVARAVWQ